MNLAIVEEAKRLEPGAAELLCAKSGVEFHPVVCDAVTDGGCKHVSHADRIVREAAYAHAAGKSVAVVAEERALAAAAEPDAKVVDAFKPTHVAAPPSPKRAKKSSGHK